MQIEKPDYPPVRRIVTGHDAHQTAKIIEDGPAQGARYPRPGAVSTLIWATDRMPANIEAGEDFEDMGARKLGTAPLPNGTRFTVNDFPPGDVGAMHRTETLDYVIVISGEIDMVTDESTVSLKAGDVMVQRGTNHAWVNKGTEVARIAFVLIDAQPLGIGNPVTGATSAGAARQ